MRGTKTVRLSLVVMAAVATLGAGQVSRASGSCPNTSASPSTTSPSVAVDPGLGVKACASWSTSGNQGHVWAGGGSGVVPVQHTLAGDVNGFYVAVGNDSVGNPDGGNGGAAKNTGCGWDEKNNKYDVGNDPSRPCPKRAKSGPYVFVATDGGPAYGPKRGILVCPVNEP